jgi:hypothetical protein
MGVRGFQARVPLDRYVVGYLRQFRERRLFASCRATPTPGRTGPDGPVLGERIFLRCSCVEHPAQGATRKHRKQISMVESHSPRLRLLPRLGKRMHLVGSFAYELVARLVRWNPTSVVQEANDQRFKRVRFNGWSSIASGTTPAAGIVDYDLQQMERRTARQLDHRIVYFASPSVTLIVKTRTTLGEAELSPNDPLQNRHRHEFIHSPPSPNVRLPRT